MISPCKGRVTTRVVKDLKRDKNGNKYPKSDLIFTCVCVCVCRYVCAFLHLCGAPLAFESVFPQSPLMLAVLRCIDPPLPFPISFFFFHFPSFLKGQLARYMGIDAHLTDIKALSCTRTHHYCAGMRTHTYVHMENGSL